MMKVFTHNSFNGHWSVGTAAVVVANSKTHAAELLEKELANAGLSQPIKPCDFSQISSAAPRARILNDGNY